MQKPFAPAFAGAVASLSLSFSLSLSLSLLPSHAHALAPDFDGERGIEAALSAGYTSFFNTSDRLVAPAAMPPTTPSNMLTGGLDLRLSVGYRIMPLVSVGVSGSFDVLGGVPEQLTGAEASPRSASAASIGAYARFYYMGLATGSVSVRRVRFESWTDLRRLDPWVSVGLEFQNLSVHVGPPGSQEFAQFDRRAVGVPIALGLDARLLPALAVGINCGITPSFAGSYTRVTQYLDSRGAVVRTVQDSDAADAVNASWVLGLSVRYTLTL